MSETLRLYGHYLSLALRAQMQYRVDFLMGIGGQALLTLTEFIAIWALFSRFGAIRDWRLAEVALLYGIAAITLSLAQVLGRGLQRIDGHIRSGGFDRILLRPRSTVLQLMGDQLALRQAGRCLQGLVILAWAGSQLEMPWTWWRVGLLLAAITGGILLFLGIFLIQAAITFLTVQSLEVYNVFTYGGETAAQYPVTFYEGWMRQALIWLLPVACITYFPVCAITGHVEELGTPFWWQCCAPAVGLVFLGIGLLAWRRGLRWYTSTGT